jgi:hypothetical protein
MFGIRTQFPPSPFSAKYQFILPPEPEAEIPMNEFDEEPDPFMLEKKDIVEKREKKLQDKKRKNKGLPGQRLLKKLAKEQQLERVLANVVKSLN